MSKLKKWGVGATILLVLGVIGSFLPESEVEEPKSQEVLQTKEKEDMSEDYFEKEINLLEPNLDTLNENKYNEDITIINQMIEKSEASSSYIVELKSKYSLTKEQDEKLTALNEKFNKYTVHYYSIKDEMKKNTK